MTGLVVAGPAPQVLDAARLDLVEELGITRTPTVLLLDGRARRSDILAALDVLFAHTGNTRPAR